MELQDRAPGSGEDDSPSQRSTLRVCDDHHDSASAGWMAGRGVVAAEDDETKELVATGPKQMNWRGILIALLVIVAVLGLIVFSIVLLSPPDEGPRVKGHKFSLDDVLGPHFRAPRFNGSWVSDVELVFRDSYGGVTILNAENLTTKVLMTNSTFRQLNAVDFKISSDLGFILLVSDIKQIHKYSYEARYSIYEVESRNKYRLSASEEDADHPLLQFVTWAPDGNALAFVYGNDVYYKPRAKNPEVHRVTSTGVPGVIYNGVPDWLYEEEILRSAGALWFSPDGQYLLYASFNDTSVGELKYPWYGSLQERLKYPEVRTLRYPKAGTRNPTVTLWAVDLNHPTQLEPADLKPSPVVKDSEDHYFTAVTWLTAHQVGVVWMNRRQNVSAVAICREPLWVCEDVHTERAGDGGWVDVRQAPVFSSDGLAFLALLPVLDGDNGRFQHVCHVSAASKQVTALTHGAFQVTRLLHWDEDRGLVYFLAAPERLPGQRHLYRAKDLNATVQSWECLTCANRTRVFQEKDPIVGDAYSGRDVSEDGARQAGGLPRCLYSRAHLSPAASPRYAVLECLGPDVPTHHLVDLVANVQLAMLDSHAALRSRVQAMARPQVKTFQVEVKSGDHAFVRLHLPPGLREYEEMIFPLVLHVCAAPGSQLVSERWQVDWGTYLASSRNFIVAQVDGRGSGFQGERVLQQLRHRLGSIEVEDQIAVIQYLRDNLNFVDRDKVAVWGWGYGGFAAAMILAQDVDVFKCGVSVAPITSWAHYDSVYTERYMGSPNVTDNYRGYEEADVTRRAAELRDKLYLLVHGTADERVHYQHSMGLVRAMAEEGVLFRHLTYPDEGHTFSGVQRHLHKAMEAFLDDCFGPINFEEWEVGTSFFSFKQ